MLIYGTALLAVCHLTGLLVGEWIGAEIGVKANVGGVGIAMLLLICSRLYLHKKGWMTEVTEQGVTFWGGMYIPVVVAMAANQNVIAALRGGPVALLAAMSAVALCACAVAVINRSSHRQSDALPPLAGAVRG